MIGVLWLHSNDWVWGMAISYEAHELLEGNLICIEYRYPSYTHGFVSDTTHGFVSDTSKCTVAWKLLGHPQLRIQTIIKLWF